jgi:hypothetical protein
VGADLVDRALCGARGNRAVGTHLGLVPRRCVIKHGARRDQPKLDQRPERNARLSTLALCYLERVFVERVEGCNPRLGSVRICLVALDADEESSEPLGDHRRRARAEEWIEHHIASMARCEKDAMEQGLGLLRGMGLATAVLFQPLGAGADGKQPVGAHLKIVVQRLHRVVVEGVARSWAHRSPHQCLMCVGEAAPAEIRHRVRLAPDHVVQHPEAQVL